ncbi:MAG: hypothetical protein JXM69_00745 [Anaerolineae bacterium]|nr:hypothetical protein [Anaerolineae bacterium]
MSNSLSETQSNVLLRAYRFLMDLGRDEKAAALGSQAENAAAHAESTEAARPFDYTIFGQTCATGGIDERSQR